jgi:hypothetical protein
MNGVLPTWLERMLGADAADLGEGTAWSLDSSWSWAPWITLLFLVFAAGWFFTHYWLETGDAGRRWRFLLGCMRLMVVLLVMFMLAEVMLALRRTGLPYVAVVIDESASMAIADRYGDELRPKLESRVKAAGFDEPTRWNLARTLLLEDDSAWLRAIEDKYKLRIYFVSADARLHAGDFAELPEQLRQSQAAGRTSALGRGVRSVLNDLRGTPPAAVVLLTDGITTEGETLTEVAAYARRKAVPLFTIGIGSEEPIRDLELSDLLVDEVVFLNDVVNFEMKLTATGYQGRSVKLTLRQKDKPDGPPLAESTATVGGDGQSQRVRLQHRPQQAGEFEYVVEVEHLPEEVQQRNNRLERVVSVRDDKVRVLLVQSYPNFEYRYLKNMLERDSTVELKVVLQEADLEYAEADQYALRVFPLRREELFQYDVILFGDVNPSFLSASAVGHLAEFVTEKGGGIVFIAGPLYTPLAYRDTRLGDLLPIELDAAVAPEPGVPLVEGFRAVPTDLGLASPSMQLGDNPHETEQIWSNLPAELYWLLETPRLKRGARVLAEHPSRRTAEGRPLPVFTLQYVGAGKVLLHATDDTWRWRRRVGDALFARYWVQTIRYLSRSKLLGKDRTAELRSDATNYPQGQPVKLRVRFFDDRQAPADDDGVTVVVEREGQPNQRVQLHRASSSRGVFEGTFGQPGEGTYHAWVATPALEGRPPSTDFEVEAPPGERERVVMDGQELRRASQETRGRFYTIANASDLPDDLPAGRQVPVEGLPPIVLWNKWPPLALCVALLVGEWIIRKRKGML